MILCGVDRSAEAARAAMVGSELAARLEVPLLLLHVAEPPWVPERTLAGRYDRMQEQAAFERAGYLASVVDPLQVNPAASVQRVVEFGEPVDVLRSVAADTRATHIVVGSRGQGAVGDVLAASTSGPLTREAPCPLIVVPPEVHEWRGDRAEVTIVCGIDDSDVSLAAVRHAAELVQRLGGRLVLAHVGDDARDGSSDAELSERAEAAASGAPIDIQRLHGRAADELLELGRRTDAALVAVGSRGRGAIKSAVLGSVSKKLVQKADRPVMVVSKALLSHPSSPPDTASTGAER